MPAFQARASGTMDLRRRPSREVDVDDGVGAEVGDAVDDGGRGAVGRDDAEGFGADGEGGGAVRRPEPAGVNAGVAEPAAGDRALDEVHRADEAGDEGGGGLAVEHVGRGDLLGAAVAHDHDAVGERQRLVLAVGDEEGGDPQPLLQVAHLLAQALAQVLVEAGEGLVEEQDLRLEHEGAGERHPLLLAAGELMRHAAGRSR